MTHDTRPAWPYPSVVAMFAHRNGQWAKKIRGATRYFGPWSQPDAALAYYRRIGPDLHAGRVPKSLGRARRDGLTVGGACGSFMAAADDRLSASTAARISPTTWRDYQWATRHLVATLGDARLVSDLGPADFSKLRAAMSGRLGPSAMGKLITITRMVFGLAYDLELIDQPVRFGNRFNKPARVLVRRAKRLSGRHLFTADEVRRLVKQCDTAAMRCMVLLAINGGLGQSDCGRLRFDHCRLDDAIPHLIYPRYKTEVDRVVPLWPETVGALRANALMREMTAAADPDDSDLVFVTPRGLPWVEDHVIKVAGSVSRVWTTDRVSPAFRRLKRIAKGMERSPSFYTLRHTFITVADEVADPHAIHRIRGHALPGMSDVYVERITLERLAAVTDHVRAWLFG